MGNETPAPIQPPTPLARKLIRYIVGFGVGTSIGLAPYLGVVNVPLFKPLLSLIPDSIQDTVIPLSAALMGTLAVVIQWYAGEAITQKALRKLFARTLIVTLLTFVVLTVVHTLVVVTLPRTAGESWSFVVGFTRPLRPPCTAEVSDAECIKAVTTDPSAIASFWGDRQIKIATLSLMFSYILFTSSFGTLVGLLVLKESKRQPAVTSSSD